MTLCLASRQLLLTARRQICPSDWWASSSPFPVVPPFYHERAHQQVHITAPAGGSICPGGWQGGAHFGGQHWGCHHLKEDRPGVRRPGRGAGSWGAPFLGVLRLVLVKGPLRDHTCLEPATLTVPGLLRQASPVASVTVSSGRVCRGGHC